MRSLRTWAVALGLSIVGLGFSNTAQAGFGGDALVVSLTVHTSGAADQIVWNNDATIGGPGVELTGDSASSVPGSALGWSIDFEDTSGCFILSVDNLAGNADTVEPLLLVVDLINNPNLALYGVTIGGINTLGVAPGDISWDADTITVSSNILNAVGPFGTLKVELCIVPEASTFVMMGIAATGLAGAVVARRRRNG
jgi:hypothetical protein